jgi:hypothetical protein
MFNNYCLRQRIHDHDPYREERSEIRLSPTKSSTNKHSLTHAAPVGVSQECKAYWIFTSLFP